MKKLFERTQVGRDFWLKWVLANTIGGLLGICASVSAQDFLYYDVEVLGGAALQAVCWMIEGAVIGAFQWLVLRRKVSQAGWWVLASAVGWPLGWAVVMGVFAPVFEAVSGMPLDPGPTLVDYNPVIGRVGIVLSPAIMGAVIGVFQWLVLRRKVSPAGSWILASTISLTLGVFAPESFLELVDEINRMFSGLMNIVVLSVFLVVGGTVCITLPSCITGSVLVWLLRHHIPDKAGAIEVA